MRRFTGILTAIGITAYFIAAGALTAQAATVSIEFTGEDFYIPRPADATDQENVERLLASYDLADNGHADLIGATCSVAGTSANGESVHVNNYGMLRSNGDSVTISGTEDESNGVRLSDRVIVLGETVRLYNVMVPDPDGIVATSVAYTVRVTCTDDTTTTTTSTPTTTSTTFETSTTTSAPTTTTTEPGTTSTSSPTSSTTVPGTSTTTNPPPSTIPPGSTTSTTAPTDSTSTSIITGSTVTTVPPVTGSTLPFTGPPVEAAGIAMAAAALLLLGGGVLLAGRER